MNKAKLILKDGTILEGYSFGANVSSSGEVVFNTAMVGYPESLTDPSYTGQILAFTYPLIGNYGIGDSDKDKDSISKRFESDKIHVKGVITCEYSENFNHWDSKKSLGDWLKENNIPGLTGIDVRELTQKIRQHGTILGKIVIESTDTSRKTPQKSRKKIKLKSSDFYNPDLENLVERVSIKKPIFYKKGPKTVVCIDCGMKNNILRNFLNRNISVYRVPWNYDFLEEKELKFDGIFISNGPGDPKMLTELHTTIEKSLKIKKPIFGICLGLQVMGIASGAETYKLKFGHRSANQPVIDVDSKRCYITSQNHGFAVNEKTLKDGWKIWLKNLNDNTVEGIKHKTLPYFACQFHPESTPGPNDTVHFFDDFIKML